MTTTGNAQSLSGISGTASHPRPCPSCGRCPTCGHHKNPYTYPPYPYTYPVYPYYSNTPKVTYQSSPISSNTLNGTIQLNGTAASAAQPLGAIYSIIT